VRLQWILGPVEAENPGPAGNTEIVRRSIAAYNRRDLEALRELNHPDVELDWSASRGLRARAYEGIENVLRFYGDFFDTFEEIHIEPERLIPWGDLVVVPNTARLRGRDGIETVARSALVFEVQGGQIAGIRLYQTADEALQAAGLAE
jgi:ketosteroid isomerase-like protein